MQESDWWRGSIIYQVYLPSFRDSGGDGIGDLRGLCESLDYIAELGVAAIWISPFYRSPMRDFGYDVADHCSVDLSFGTLDDFDQLIARAHGLGLRVLIDQVWPHTSSDHRWFRASAASRSGAEADWYIWADPRADGAPPNNWLSVFGGSAWRWGPTRRQYYLHHFLPSQPKLNLRNEEVLQALFANAQFWLDRGVDGFRLDAMDFFLHDEELRDNPPRTHPTDAQPWNPFRRQRHVYDMAHPDTDGLVQRLRQFIDGYRNSVLLGELSSEAGAIRRAVAITGSQRLHMAYALGMMKSPFTAEAFRRALAEAVLEKNGTGSFCWAFSNHDVSRVVSRWNPEASESLAFLRLQSTLLLCLPGSVCLFQGEELGLPDARLSLDQIRDPFGLAFAPAYLGRDAARTPLPWQATALNLGFSSAQRTWLPVAPEHAALAVDRQMGDPQSALAWYRRMIAWRKRHPALVTGELELIGVPEPALAFARRGTSESILACFNLAAEAIELRLSDLPQFRCLDEPGFTAASGGEWLSLPPFGIAIGVIEG